MKISVTEDLAKKIILDHFGLSWGVEIEIQTDNKSNENTQSALDFNNIIRHIACLDINGRDKLKAISYLQKQTGFYLTEVKWVIEHWAQFCDFVDYYHCLPSFEGNYPNYRIFKKN